MNPPIPTALKILRGNPGKRPLNKLEPQPKEFSATPPDYLDADAVTEWGRLVPILKRMRVLTEADYMALAIICQAYSTMVAAQKQLTLSGLLFKTSTGYVQQSPLLAVVNSNMATVTVMLREFGMTPSARGRVKTTEPEKKAGNRFDALG